MIKRFIGEIHVDDHDLAMDVAKALETSAAGYDIEVYDVHDKFDIDRPKRTTDGRVTMKVFKFENPA